MVNPPGRQTIHKMDCLFLSAGKFYPLPDQGLEYRHPYDVIGGTAYQMDEGLCHVH